jgi:hypothetical protein
MRQRQGRYVSSSFLVPVFNDVVPGYVEDQTQVRSAGNLSLGSQTGILRLSRSSGSVISTATRKKM